MNQPSSHNKEATQSDMDSFAEAIRKVQHVVDQSISLFFAKNRPERQPEGFREMNQIPTKVTIN